MSLRSILQEVNSSSGLSKENLIDRIKDKLQQESQPYDEWKEGKFDINYMFMVLKCNLLLIAAEYGYKKVVRYLIENGANVNIQDKWGITSLHYSAQRGHTQVVEVLLKEGADVNIQDRGGRTPLQYAVQRRYLKLAKLLLNDGVDPSFTHRSKAITAGITVGILAAIVAPLALIYATVLPALAIVGITVASALIVGGIAYGVAYKHQTDEICQIRKKHPNLSFW